MGAGGDGHTTGWVGGQGWWGAGGQGWSWLRAHPVSQAGKFGLIPTLISLGTGAAWLGVVSAESVGKHAPSLMSGLVRAGLGGGSGHSLALPSPDHLPL